LFTVLAAAAGAWAGPSGDPNDIYVMSDAHSEVYQYGRTNPWPYVPGSYAGFLSPPWNNVFSNSTQTGPNAPYLGAVAGTNDDLFIGGFGGLTRLDSATGAQVQIVATGLRIGPAKAPNGNIVVGGPTGTEEYNPDTGAFVRTVEGYGSGYNLHAFRGNEMFVSQWGGSGATVIKRFDFTSGLSSGADIAVPFVPQEIGFGPGNVLLASALYEGDPTAGLWRYNEGPATWTQVIQTDPYTTGAPHGFTIDPVNGDIYMACYTGDLLRFDSAYNYLNTIDTIPTKLTDVLFHRVVPEPASMALLGLGAVALLRRRR